jgi:hypothetical protein
MPHKSFEFKVEDTTYELEVGKCAVALFYKNAEVDYVAINHTDEPDDTVRIFNADLARWAAGFAPVWDEEDEAWYYPATYWELEGEDQSFRGAMGWNPTTVLKNEPFEWEMDKYVLLQTAGVDSEITDFLGER